LTAKLSDWLASGGPAEDELKAVREASIEAARWSLQKIDAEIKDTSTTPESTNGDE
jgi:hypothetical protein